MIRRFQPITWILRFSLIALLCLCSMPVLAQTTATVTGTVKDSQGGVIPGATVTLLSETRGTSLDTVTTTTGDFVFPNITGDTYTVRVAMEGFKTLERKGVAVSPGDRVVVGTLTIDVGTLAETVLVSGDAPLIQAQTGDLSFTVARQQVEDVPNSGRNFASFAALVPGVTSTIVAAGTNTALARLGGGTTNYLLDGVSNVDPGGNGQGIQLNSDAIAEVKVLTNAYQAEYGRSSGLQISGVTKSGSNQFRGSVYGIERRSDWNANSWANVLNGIAKPVVNQTDWGNTFGGPIGKPGGKNKWFFFFSQQFSPRTTSGAVNLFRVPTALERQGNFSQTTDNTGALFPYIKDPSSTSPCSAANTAGCFQSGGVLGVIPAAALYPTGLNILNIYPMPNLPTVPGVPYNLRTVAPVDQRTTWQPVFRTDYQASGRLRLTAKLASQVATSKPLPGTIPGFNDTFQVENSIYAPSGTVDFTLNNSTIIEGTWGMNWDNQLNPLVNDAVSNRCNDGLCPFPELFPNAGVVPTNTWDYGLLQRTGSPFFVNGVVYGVPDFTWGSRVANQPPLLTYRNNIDFVRTNDFAGSVTKLVGGHTFKAGVQLDHMLKVQLYGASGSIPFQGTIDFGNNNSNPLDTGFGFANAAIGVFNAYSQQEKFIEGHFIYNSLEGFLQDTWKVNSKVSLDYGLRITHEGPNYDTNQQGSNFFPAGSTDVPANLAWSASAAPQLYQPGCSVAVVPCPVASRVAIDPTTGLSLGALTASDIGNQVPGTGNFINGVVQAGHGIAKSNYLFPTVAVEPRLGVAYDISGNQKFVFRGALGLFRDRPSGQYTFAPIGNPPNGQVSTVNYSTLQSIPATGLATLAPPLLAVFEYQSPLPSNLDWNAGVQMALPWSSALDVSYLGTHGYNILAFGASGTTTVPSELDLNAPDLGAAYLPQYQDPTLAPSAIPGASAVNANLLRPYRGLGIIYTSLPRFWTQYDALQTVFNRRFSHGWSAGLNWTLTLRNDGNTLSPLHFAHSASGVLTVAPQQSQLDALLSNVGLRRHIIKANWVWDLPKMDGSSSAARVLGAVINDWQLSGVFTAGSGVPYDATYSYQSNGTNTNLTGSPDYFARVVVTGNHGSGCSSNQYQQFNTAAYSGPTYGSIGNESGVNLLTSCSLHIVDMSLSRNIHVGSSRNAQIRVDAFNLFNFSIINASNVTETLASPAAPTTIVNAQYSSPGVLNPARVLPQNAGFGGATGTWSNRTVQAQIRFQF